MTFDVVTIFPGFFTSMLEHGVLKRASAGGEAEIRIHDLRDYADDRHRTVDDRPFGGGPGMVFKPEPLFRAVEAIAAQPAAGGDGQEGATSPQPPVILLSPQGRLFTQAVAEEWARPSRMILICGRYEGVDERVASHLATGELSIGDYVLSGGELAAAVVMEAVTRLLPGVLGNEDSSQQDSFGPMPVSARQTGPTSEYGHEYGWSGAEGESPVERAAGDGNRRSGLLDCPHYTRPVEFRGLRVPEVLLSGNHEEVRRWRRRGALLRTWQRRPDLLESLPLTAEDARWLKEFRGERREAAPA